MKNKLYYITIVTLFCSRFLHACEPTVAFASWQEYWENELKQADQKLAASEQAPHWQKDQMFEAAKKAYQAIAYNGQRTLPDDVRQAAQAQLDEWQRLEREQNAVYGRSLDAQKEALGRDWQERR